MNQIINMLLQVPVAFAQNSETATAANKAASQFENMVNSIIQAIPLWFTALIVLIISFVLARVVKNSVENRMTSAGLEEEHKEIQIVAGRTSSVIVMTLGATAALKIAGLDLTPIIAAAAFGIGFALRDIIMNFLAGIIVLLQKQFTIGDWIKIKGTTGIVKEIQSRYTIIKKFDGTKAIIPNSDLFKNQVTNLTGNGTRRFTINLGVDRYYDLKEAIDLIYKSIAKVDRILKAPRPSIIVTQPGGYYNNLQLRCWVEAKKGVLKPISALMRQVHKDFYKRGWAWPFPTQTVIMDKDDDKNNVTARQQAYIEKQKHKKKKMAQPEPLVQAAPIQPQTTVPPVQPQSFAPVQNVTYPQAAPQPQAMQQVPLWLQKATGQAILNQPPAPVNEGQSTFTMPVITSPPNQVAPLSQAPSPLPVTPQTVPAAQPAPAGPEYPGQIPSV